MKNSVVALSNVKTKIVIGGLGIIITVLVPQLFHILGSVSGLGNSLGTAFLPMHLVVMLVGLLAGPIVGGMVGLFSPAINMLITGMPTSLMMPFMMVELGTYGLVLGFLSNVKMKTILKVLIAQVGGRLIRGLTIIIGIYLLGSKISIETILNSILVGLPGIILQLTILPLLIFYLNNQKRKDV